MQRIIVLIGHSNCGKSHTLNILRELIRNNGGVSLSANPPYNGEKPETFKYKDQVIALCPGGDNIKIIKRNFDYAYSKNADIIITAAHYRGKTISYIDKTAAEIGITAEKYKKSIEYHLSPETQTHCNEEFAKVLFDRLR